MQLSYARAVQSTKIPTIVQPTQPSLVSFSSISDNGMERLIHDKLHDQKDAMISINDLEHQVQKTSEEIFTIEQTFEEQLHSISQSVENLSEKVNTKYVELTASMAELSGTIKQQNNAIQKIQMDFKESMQPLW